MMGGNYLFAEMFPQNFRKYTRSKKQFNLRQNPVPKIKIWNNSFYKEIILVPNNKVTVISVHNVELSLHLVTVTMLPVKLDFTIFSFHQTETFLSSTVGYVFLVLMAVGTLDQVQGLITCDLEVIFKICPSHTALLGDSTVTTWQWYCCELHTYCIIRRSSAWCHVYNRRNTQW